MKRCISTLCIGIFAGSVAVAQPVSTAIVVQTYSFAPVGLVSGQTMRLNLANLAGGSSVCMGNFSFINSDGSTIKTQAVTVKAGQTYSYSVQPSDISSSTVNAEIRGVVAVDRQAGGILVTPGNPPTVSPACSPLMSLEIVDNASGQTHILLTGPTTVSGIVPVITTPVKGLQ